jgi:replicative DNA helicase
MSTYETNVADLDLEAAAVSECLRRYDRFAARGLTTRDFTLALHRSVVDASQRLFAAGKPVNVETVALELQRAGAAPPEGAIRLVASLAAVSPTMIDEERLVELRRLRGVVDAGRQVVRLAEAGDLPGALTALRDVDLMGDQRQVQTAYELAKRVFDSLMDDTARAERRIALGLAGLDHAIGELGVGSMLVVAADSNVGKSQFALELMLAAEGVGTRSGLISMEDPEDVTGSRLLGAASEVSGREIQRNNFIDGRPVALEKLAAGLEKLQALGERVMFAERTGQTDIDVCAAMTSMAARGVRLVVVDYLQETGLSGAAQDRRNEIRVIAKKLKMHAIRLNMALVLVSQIARPKDGLTTTKPSKHSLKESGDVTNMAECIVVLWRDDESDFAPIRAAVVKSKWGGVGREWTMQRNKRTGRLEELRDRSEFI